MSARGWFIVIEGGDGSGKTTHIPALVGWLATVTDREIVTTREPGGTQLGVTLRQLLLHEGAMDAHTEALLYAADRAEHVAQVIRPALARGAIVVGDRYIDSSIAYQVEGRGLALADVVDINRFASGGLVPDLTCILDVDPLTAAARRHGQADRLESESLDFHARVRQRYLSLADAAPRRYRVIDTSVSVNQAHQALCAAVADAVGLVHP